MNPPQQPYTYEQSGFNPFLERSPRIYTANDRINTQASPFIESVVDNAIIYDPFTDTQSQNLNQASQPMSADQIQGGSLTSANGNLTIDLTNGQLNFNDGAVNLFNVGGNNASGIPNSLTAQNSQGQTILSS